MAHEDFQVYAIIVNNSCNANNMDKFDVLISFSHNYIFAFLTSTGMWI